MINHVCDYQLYAFSELMQLFVKTHCKSTWIYKSTGLSECDGCLYDFKKAESLGSTEQFFSYITITLKSQACSLNIML